MYMCRTVSYFIIEQVRNTDLVVGSWTIEQVEIIQYINILVILKVLYSRKPREARMFVSKLLVTFSRTRKREQHFLTQS